MTDASITPWVLLLEDDERALLEQLRLTERRYRIGRGEACEVRLDDRNISREHAELALDEAGVWWVRDRGSMYGSFVNGLRLDETPKALEAGDCLQVGDRLLTFRLEEFGAPLPTAFAAAGRGGFDGEFPPRLLVVQGPEAGHMVRLDEGPVTLGGVLEANARLEGEPFAGIAIVLRALADGRYEVLNRGECALYLGLQSIEHAILSDGDLLFVEDDKGEVILRLRYLAEGQQEPTCPGQPLPFLSVPPLPFGSVPPGPSFSSVPPPPFASPPSASVPPAPFLPAPYAPSPPARLAPPHFAPSPPLRATDPPPSVQTTWGEQSSTTLRRVPQGTAAAASRSNAHARWGVAAAGALVMVAFGLGGWRVAATHGPDKGATARAGGAAASGFAAGPTDAPGRGEAGPGQGDKATGEGPSTAGALADAAPAGAAGAAGDDAAEAPREGGEAGGRRSTKQAKGGRAGAANWGVGLAPKPGETDESVRARLEHRVFGGRASPAEVQQLRQLCARASDRACRERLQTLLANDARGL